MGDVDDLNRTVMAYTKYVADKQRHDLTVYNAMQKRVSGIIFVCDLLTAFPCSFFTISFRPAISLFLQQAENEQREARGEPPLSFDDIKKMKPPQLTTKCGMLESFLCSSDAKAHSDYAAEACLH